MDKYKLRRILIVIISIFIFASVIIINTKSLQNVSKPVTKNNINDSSELAIEKLSQIPVKGRAPKTDYKREQFGAGWNTTKGCDTRNIILNRDLSNVSVDKKCNVISGILNDPYTGRLIEFKRGSKTSEIVQIDHVVPLSDAWQKGAQQLTLENRIKFANDPLELLAVSSDSNMQKSDGDAATWLPANKPFRCQYVARQIAVKIKYSIWVTQAEQNAMKSVLNKCPEQLLPSP